MQTYTREEQCRLWLQSAPSLSWRTREALLTYFGCAESIFEQNGNYRILLIKCYLISTGCQKQAVFAHAGSCVNGLKIFLICFDCLGQHLMLKTSIGHTMKHIFKISLIAETETG